MRKLNSGEREYLKKLLEAKTIKVTKIMGAFKIFGGLQIAALLLYMILGNVNGEDIPFMLVGCVILFLVYFKLTGFLAKQNQWKRMLEAVKKGKEFVCDGVLVNTYETRHGEKTGATEMMGNVSVNGKEVRCNVEAALMGKVPGTPVVLVCTYTNLDLGFKLAIGTGK